MPAVEVRLDGKALLKPLSPGVSVAKLCSAMDKALLKARRRVRSAISGGCELLSPGKDGSAPLESFLRIDCESEAIPEKPKRAIVTLNIGHLCDGMHDAAMKSFALYAEKTGSDLLTIDSVKMGIGGNILFEKWQLYDLLFEYGRILYVDSDILIAPDCPDLFDLVPCAAIGGFNEDDYSDRSEFIAFAQSILGDIGWRRQYLNIGMGVYSWIHRAIFERPAKWDSTRFAEQNLYNFRIVQDKARVMRLPAEFNRMNICGEDRDRLEGYIVHYAGTGYLERELPPELAYPAKAKLMREDWQALSARRRPC